MPVKKIELLSCPFCGGRVTFIYDTFTKWNKGIICKKCFVNAYFFTKAGLNVSISCSDKNTQKIEIADKWNRRTK